MSSTRTDSVGYPVQRGKCQLKAVPKLHSYYEVPIMRVLCPGISALPNFDIGGESQIVSRSGRSLVQSREGRPWRFRLRLLRQPTQDPHHIHDRCCHQVLEVCFCLAQIACLTHLSRTDALRDRSFDSGAFCVLRLKLRRLFALPSFQKCHMVRLWPKCDGSTWWC